MLRNDMPEPDEPPDPISTALGIAASVAGIAGTTIGVVQSHKAAKMQQQQMNAQKKTSVPLPALPPPVNDSALQVGGGGPTLTPGEKANLINTSPQGLLDSDTTRRQTLLGS